MSYLFSTGPNFPVAVLDAFQTNPEACLLTPTATLAEHIRHRLARQGAFVRPDSIVTLSRFIEPVVRDIQAAPTAVISHLVLGELQRNPPALFRPLASSRGLRRMLTSLIEEVGQSTANTTGLSEAARAFFGLFTSIESQLKTKGYVLRPARLRIAAARLKASPTPWPVICLTGFYAFTPAELEVLAALRPARIILSLPDWESAEESRKKLREMGFHERRIEDPPASAKTMIVTASSDQQEVEDIARRILDHRAQGRAFRDIGILVRREHPYVPLLRTMLARYGIPARYYFQKALHSHPLARYLLAFLNALASHWDYSRILPLLRMPLSGLAGALETDVLDHTLRERLPARGLPAQLAALGWDRFQHWTTAHYTPVKWMEELCKLQCIVRPPALVDGVPHSQVLAWREFVSARQAWDDALVLAASMLDPEEAIPLAAFQQPLADALEHSPISDRDQRRDVVHVFDVYEARQWRLPVVFLCGMLERAFPQYHSGHPILSDADREELRREGLLLRTAAERQREESFLFNTAVHTATEQLVLSYPRANTKGEETLPSFFLAGLQRVGAVLTGQTQPSRPKPIWPKALAPRPQISDSEVLAALRTTRGSLSPTSIETYLQCPFQFFTRHILRLNPPPARPHERLDFLLQGNILHRTLAEADGSPLLVEEIFAQLFTDACREKSVPAGCLTEKARLELHHNLRRFIESPPLTGARTKSVEKAFDFRVDGDLRIRGKIDCVVELPARGLVVIDYKYSTRDRIRGRIRSHDRGELVQGGLYLWAAGKLYRSEPAGMLYCGLRGEVTWDGWHLPTHGWQDIGESWEQEQLREMMERAVESSLDVAARISRGEIAPQPADIKKCAWCEFRDTCRVESRPAPLVQVVGGGG